MSRTARGWVMRGCIAALVVGVSVLPRGAQAEVIISTKPTQNMACSGGVCAPTARDAVLNVNDLETMLAGGNATITTTGNGVQADNLRVDAALSWSSTAVLTLDAHRSIAINEGVSVEGLAGLSLATNAGGKNGVLAFGKKGNVTFADLSSRLAIDGVAYTLVDTIRSLAAAIAGNPSGAFGFAADYDASQDGTYTSNPIPTTFTGIFEGLGHRISNLTIDDRNDSVVGLFGNVGTSVLRDITLVDANMTAENGATLGALVGGGTRVSIANVHSVDGVLYGAEGEGGGSNVGGLVGDVEFAVEITGSSASGSVTDQGPEGSVGGLVAVFSSGTITLSHSSAKVSAPSAGGGLVGSSGGAIDQSYATGKVSNSSSVDIDQSFGGLVGANYGTIADSYCTGDVSGSGGGNSAYGGLIGANGNGENVGQTVGSSYSTGKVRPAPGALRGGLVGVDTVPGDIADGYWDIDTSGIRRKSRGAGSPKNDPGITGLSTRQLQSGLPSGFDPKIWGEDPHVNNGLPYLLANPPS